MANENEHIKKQDSIIKKLEIEGFKIVEGYDYKWTCELSVSMCQGWRIVFHNQSPVFYHYHNKEYIFMDKPQRMQK